MADRTGFQHMSELARRLTTALKGLETGQLRTAELDELCNDSRELYERAVVLRHKARESMVKSATTPNDVPNTEVNEPVEIKLDTSAASNDKAQISLIDVIQETDTTTKKEKVIEAESVAQRMKNSPISDLRTAIGLNMKFMFISELFKDDRAAYERTLEELNTMGSTKKAMDHLTVVLAKLDTPADEEVVESFRTLLERRYA